MVATWGYLCGLGAWGLGCELVTAALGLIIQALGLTRPRGLYRVVCAARRFPKSRAKKNLARGFFSLV